jgi:pyruvate formate lyase activating enzyme
LDNRGKATEIRIPYVPGYNDGEIAAIRDFVKTLRHVTAVRVLPYHNYAGSKYAALDMENTLPANLPEDAALDAAKKLFSDAFIPLK